MNILPWYFTAKQMKFKKYNLKNAGNILVGITWRKISAWCKDKKVVKIPNSSHSMFWAVSTSGTGIREENHIPSATSEAWSIKKLPDTWRSPARKLLAWLVYDRVPSWACGMWTPLPATPNSWFPPHHSDCPGPSWRTMKPTRTPQREMVKHLSMKGGHSLCDKRAVILKQEGLMRKGGPLAGPSTQKVAAPFQEDGYKETHP